MDTVISWLNQLKDETPEMKEAVEKFESSISESGFDETEMNYILEKDLRQIELDLKNTLNEKQNVETKAN